MAVTPFYWKIKGLTWGNILARYVLWLMVAFLTDVWRLNYQKAAMAINIFWGIVDMAPSFTQYIVYSYMGNYRMASLSSFMYTSGLLCLSLSALGTCNEDKVSCHVKKRYKFLFYLALPQLIGGISFHRLNSIDELLCKEVVVGPGRVTSSTDEEVPSEQQEGSRSRPNSNNIEELPREEVGSKSRPSKWQRLLNIVILIVIHLVGGFALPNIKQWPLRFGIPAMFMLVATVFFVSGSYSKHTPTAPGSFLTTMRSVVVASFSRSTSTVPNQEYNNHSQTPYGSYLRCLDRAIITLPYDDEEQKNKIIQNVEETKRAMCRIPFCIAFFMLGVVSSIGDTYFIEQANTMNNMVGSYEVPLVVLQLCYELSKTILTELYLLIMEKLLNYDSEGSRNHDVVSSKYVGCVGITMSMIFAILCCFAAADVEKYRLDKVKDMYNKYGPDYDGKIPMSMFWLVPQFFLLGGFDGILQKSIGLFFKHQAQTPSDRIMGLFSSGIIGFGRVGSVVSVLVAQKITAWGDNTSWFVKSLNDSRLDKYYWVLVALSLGNLIYYKNFYYCTSLRSEVRV